MSNPFQPFPPTLSRPSFLDEVLEAVMDHPLCKANQLDRLAVVLPSHRAMSKLRRGLMTRLTGPARLPQFYALSGFIERLRLGRRRTRWKSWCGCIGGGHLGGHAAV